MVNVLCMKWGTRYGPEYVNRLQAMVSRNLSLPHRFVCMADDFEGLNSKVEALPLPELVLPPGAPDRGWRKLFSFMPSVGDLEGVTLFLDIDIVIIDKIDAFFEHPGDFCIIRDWTLPWRYTGNSSVYRYTIGKHTDVLDYFEANKAEVCSSFRTEQGYLTAREKLANRLVFWPEEWCRSFKRHCMPKGPMGLIKAPAAPAGTKIVVFHGHPKPDEAIRGESRKATRPMKPAPWIADFWHE